MNFKEFNCAMCSKVVLPWREDTLRHETRIALAGEKTRKTRKVCNACYDEVNAYRKTSYRTELDQRVAISSEYIDEPCGGQYEDLID